MASRIRGFTSADSRIVSRFADLMPSPAVHSEQTNPENHRSRMQCPLCCSSGTQPVQILGVETLIAEWARNFQIDVRSQYHSVSQIELRRCPDCGLSFFLPESLSGSGELYSQLERFDWYYMARKWEYDVALEDLRGCKRVLEVGCGSGGFMILSRSDGAAEIEGLEQNTKAIQEARDRGLRVNEATVEEAAIKSPAAYDAVCSFQVLEHVARPREFLQACCSLLRPGGRLLLGLPNADSFIRHEFNVLDMPPHHMSRWPVDVFRALPRFFPLKVRRLKFEHIAEYHIESYVNAQCSHFGRGRLELLNRPRLKSWLRRILRLGLRRGLRGQTVYACYERL
jgi:2-polyprenyl-3-methyl-5-hydroxy-6-metoxy-1,4-benzoquinol methylase